MADLDTMPGLLLRLKDDAIELIESEVGLIKAEIFDRANTMKIALVPLGLGAVCGVTGLMLFAAALVMWVGEALDGRFALAAVLVGLGFLLIAGVGLAIAAKLIIKVTQPPVTPPRAPIHAIEVRHEQPAAAVQRPDQA